MAAEQVENFARHDTDGPLRLHVESGAEKRVHNGGPTTVAFGPLDRPNEIDGVIPKGETETFTRSAYLFHPGFTTLSVTTVPPETEDDE